MEAILGKEVVLMFKKDDTFSTFACAIDCSIDVDSETVNVNTVGDGMWNKERTKALSYSISLNGLAIIDEDYTGWDLLENQIAGVNVFYRMVFTDEAGAIKNLVGQVTITHSTFNGGSDGHAGNSFTLKGFGGFVIIDGTLECNAEVLTFGHVKVGTVVTLSFTASADTEYISYELYDFTGTLKTSGNLYTPSFSFVSSTHQIGFSGTIKARPYCINDQAGTLFEQVFTP